MTNWAEYGVQVLSVEELKALFDEATRDDDDFTCSVVRDELEERVLKVTI